MAALPPKPLVHDYRTGVNHRLRSHYWHAKVRSDLSRIQRNDRDQTTQRVELGERAQDALSGQARLLEALLDLPRFTLATPTA